MRLYLLLAFGFWLLALSFWLLAPRKRLAFSLKFNHFKLRRIDGRRDQLVDELDLHRPFEFFVAAGQPARDALPDTRLDLETVADGDVVVKLQFLFVTDQLHLSDRSHFLHERVEIGHMQDFRDQLRLEQAPQPFQWRLDEDVASEHRPEDFPRVVVRSAFRGLITYPPDLLQWQIADDAVFQAEVTELELVQRRGLDGADDFRAGRLQNRFVKFWYFCCSHLITKNLGTTNEHE